MSYDRNTHRGRQSRVVTGKSSNSTKDDFVTLINYFQQRRTATGRAHLNWVSRAIRFSLRNQSGRQRQVQTRSLVAAEKFRTCYRARDEKRPGNMSASSNERSFRFVYISFTSLRVSRLVLFIFFLIFSRLLFPHIPLSERSVEKFGEINVSSRSVALRGKKD